MASRPLLVALGAGATALIAAALNLSVPESQRSEGVRLDVYADPVHGIALPTVCYGDTGPDVQFGDARRTIDECVRLLLTRHEARARKILTCLREESQWQVTPGVLAMLISLDDNTGKGCSNSIVRDLNEGKPREQACRRLTTQVATWQPAKRVNGKAVPDWSRPPLTGPTGWTLVRPAFDGKRVALNCRDPINNCRGLVLRREREQAICLS